MKGRKAEFSSDRVLEFKALPEERAEEFESLLGQCCDEYFNDDQGCPECEHAIAAYLESIENGDDDN